MIRALGGAAGFLLAVVPSAGQSLAVPLTSGEDWEVISHTSRTSHAVRFTADGLVVDVRRSAGSLAYPLTAPVTVTHVHAQGLVTGRLLVDADRQGDEGQDDFVLRLGLVESGARRLNVWQRAFAAGWVKRLFALAPPGTGLSRVHFLSVGAGDRAVGRTRRHPLHELLHETVVAALRADGRFVIDTTIEAPARTVGIWLMVDGDDTNSEFTVTIERIELTAAPGGRGF